MEGGGSNGGGGGGGQEGEGHAGTGVGVFEVFRLSTLAQADLDALPLDDLRARYSLLLPITDRSQLRPPFELAALPPPEHVVVDKTRFQDMLAREARKQVDAAAKRDEPLFQAHDAFARDRAMISALLREKLDGQRERLRTLITSHAQRGKEKHELLSALKAFADEDEQMWNTLLHHPFFRGEEEERGVGPSTPSE